MIRQRLIAVECSSQGNENGPYLRSAMLKKVNSGFTPSSFCINEQGKVQPMMLMTNAGYQFLVGKLTDKKAVEHQIAFIHAFDAMERFIKNQSEGLSLRYLKQPRRSPSE